MPAGAESNYGTARKTSTTGFGFPPAIVRAQEPAVSLAPMPGKRRRRSTSGQVATLIEGGADRGGIGLRDHEHWPIMLPTAVNGKRVCRGLR